MSQPAVRPDAAPVRRKPRPPTREQVAPGTEVGPYVVERPLGAGGFGSVYLARRGEQLHALKFLSLERHSGWAEREVAVLSRMRHRHVARLHGFWRWPEGQPRFAVVVMQYVEGQRLDAWTRQHNPCARRVLQLLRDMSQGLAAVHALGVVHRDVKEANLLVREQDGAAVLVDFGVSGCQHAPRVTRGVMPPGTWEYRSPEAWRFWRQHAATPGAHYQSTPADDMYALGVVLYWLVTDALPFPVDDGTDVDAVLAEAPVPPRERNPRVPRELSELCLRLLSKQPEERPAAGALEREAEALLERQGPEWEAPLCEPFSDHHMPDEEDAEERWARPRRGQRPLRPPEPVPAQGGAPEQPAGASAPMASAALAVPQAPPAPAAVPAATAHGEGARRRLVTGALVALVLAVVGLTGWLAARGLMAAAPTTTSNSPVGLDGSLPTWKSGEKVAAPLKPPEAERAVPLAPEGAPPAPVAAGATAPPAEASVNTEQHKQPKRLGAARKAAALLSTCTALAACSGPSAEVRPPSVFADPVEPCPPGSLEAMEQLGIRIGKGGYAQFTWHKGYTKPVPIQEGWQTLRTGDDFGQLDAGTVLSGRIILSEKYAWGHWVQATTEDGKTYPVCFESKERRNDDGEVPSNAGVEAVREFGHLR